MVISITLTEETYRRYGLLDPENPRRVIQNALEEWIAAHEEQKNADS